MKFKRHKNCHFFKKNQPKPITFAKIERIVFSILWFLHNYSRVLENVQFNWQLKFKHNVFKQEIVYNVFIKKLFPMQLLIRCETFLLSIQFKCSHFSFLVSPMNRISWSVCENFGGWNWASLHDRTIKSNSLSQMEYSLWFVSESRRWHYNFRLESPENSQKTGRRLFGLCSN